MLSQNEATIQKKTLDNYSQSADEKSELHLITQETLWSHFSLEKKHSF